MKKMRKIVLTLIILMLLNMVGTLFLTESMAEDTLGLNTTTSTTDDKGYDRNSTSTWQATTPTPSAPTTAPTTKPVTTTQSIPAAGTKGVIVVVALVIIGVTIAIISYKKDKYMNL